MERLGELGLRDGGLMTIRHPHLVERYNRALETLIGRRTTLTTFRIDATGFSPEVAAEIADPDYMNPLGVNRRYILLDIHQKDLPVLDQRFTSTRWLMKAFISQNEGELFTLTSKDAVYGDLEDNTYKVTGLEDLLSIKKVIFTVNTPTGLVEKAVRLTKLIEDFRTSDTMWMNERAITEMVELAKAAGDVRRNPTIPRNLVFRKGNFHSTHLGGLYVFHGEDRVTVIHETQGFSCPDHWQSKPVHAISVEDVEGVVNFLVDADLVHWPNASFVTARKDNLLRKLEFIVIDHASAKNAAVDLTDWDYEETKAYIYRHHDELPPEFHQMSRALKYVDSALDWDATECDARTVAYMTTAKPGHDRDIVNHLLAHLTPADYLGTFRRNNALFLKRYEGWGEARRSYVAEFLRRRFTGKSAAVLDTVFEVDDPFGDDAPIMTDPWTAL